MTSKAQRRQKRRRETGRGQGLSPLGPGDLGNLPRPLRMVVESTEQFRRYMLAAQGDPEAAAAAARAGVGRAVTEIAALAEPYDAFDVLECIRLSQLSVNPETYRETEHEGSAAMIEMVALVLAARGARAGTLPEEAGRRPRPDPVIDKVLQAAGEAVQAGSMLPVLGLVADPEGATDYRLGAVLREVFVRNMAYLHMEEDTLEALFGTPEIEADCRGALGCTVGEVRSVFDVLVRLHREAWHRRFEVLDDFVEVARSEVTQARAKGADYELSSETREVALELWSHAWGDPGDCSTYGADQLADETSLPVARVEAVLSLFGVEMVSRDPIGAVEEFFSGHNPFRTAPILRDPAGTAVVVHPGLLSPAIRERVEQGLRDAGRWDPYVKHRGAYLEGAAIDLLTPHLPGCKVLRGYEYFRPNPRAFTPETEPSAYTSLVEGDGLLLVDDVALIVEGKAGTIDRRSRMGDPQRLYSDLRDIVTAAADQAERVRQRIVVDGGLRLKDGSWLDLSHVREVHSIAVSLEDLSGMATVTSELVRTGLLSHSHLPWTLSLHDLRIISELVEQPAELLLYLRRRTEPEVTRKFHAVDELDFFLQFYSGGLYVEPDPDRVAAELPQFGEPSVASRRRFKSQALELLTSRTDQLDAWYFHQLGIRETPAPKPRLNADPDLYALVSALTARSDPGWLRTGASLLDANGGLQKQMGAYARRLTAMSKSDGGPHSLTVIGGTRADDSFLLTWSSMGGSEDIAAARRRLVPYLEAKKHQAQVALGAVLVFGPDDPVAPRLTLYDNRRPGPDPGLDEVVKSSGLRPLERSTARFPTTARSRAPKRR